MDVELNKQFPSSAELKKKEKIVIYFVFTILTKTLLCIFLLSIETAKQTYCSISTTINFIKFLIKEKM